MTTLKFFEEGNRLYVQIENPPKDLKEKLIALTTASVINVLEGLVPQNESKPDIPVDDDFVAASPEDEIPFAPAEEAPEKEEPKKPEKKAKTIEELAADDDWA